MSKDAPLTADECYGLLMEVQKEGDKGVAAILRGESRPDVYAAFDVKVTAILDKFRERYREDD